MPAAIEDQPVVSLLLLHTCCCVALVITTLRVIWPCTHAFSQTFWCPTGMCLFLCVYAQVGIIGPDRKFKILTAAEVQDYLQEVE